MTRSSPARRRVRRLGRPPKDFTSDPDRLIVDLAAALRPAWGLSERQAVDLALAVIDGSPIEPSKLPRGAKYKSGLLIGYQLARHASFRGRNATIRRKLRQADKGVVLALTVLIRQPSI
jgi:hypothetical protein